MNADAERRKQSKSIKSLDQSFDSELAGMENSTKYIMKRIQKDFDHLITSLSIKMNQEID